MDCETCESSLLDLAYGELSAERAAEARSHMARCGTCRSSFERLDASIGLARKLPIEEPPAALTERLMQAARAQAIEAKPRPFGNLGKLWMELIGRVAMGRQVAMATVMALIVLVGMWSVPQLSRKPEAVGGTVINPEHEGEAGPSALVPAEPLDLAVDTRSGRIRRKDEIDALRARAEEAKSAAAGAPRESASSAAAAHQSDETERVEPTEQIPVLDDGDSEFAIAERASAKNADAPFAAPSNAFAQEGSLEGAGARDAYEAEHAPAASEPSGYAKAPAPRAAASGGSAADKKELSADGAASPQVTAVLVERYRARDYAGTRAAAREILSDDRLRAQHANALLYLARAERQTEGCAQAALVYERIVADYATSSAATTALTEGVSCLDELGRAERADALLASAERSPALKAAAQRATAARAKGAAKSAPAKTKAKPVTPEDPALDMK